MKFKVNILAGIIYSFMASGYQGDLWILTAGIADIKKIPSSQNRPLPGPRAMHSLLYDENNKRILLLDGYYPSIQPEKSEVWSWKGTEWILVDSTGPEPRYASASVYDNRRNRVVTNGGRIGHSELIIGDTWEWDGRQWFQIKESSSNARDHHSMVYHSGEETTVMFGGGIFPRREGPWVTDTWEWDGKEWTRVDSAGPIGRVAPMVYDSKRKSIILFGGVGAPPGTGQPQPDYRDTWSWKNKKWSKISEDGPSARNRHAMAFDQKRNRVILYGGSVGQNVLSDMWQWDGLHWTEIKMSGSTPGKRCLHAMAYDAERDRIILYGGNNGTTVDGETWEWDGDTWTKKSG